MGRATFHQRNLLRAPFSLAFSWKHILGSWSYMLVGYFAFGICSSYSCSRGPLTSLVAAYLIIWVFPILMLVFMTEDVIALTWFVLSKITFAITCVFLNFWDSWLWIAVYPLLFAVISTGIKVKLMRVTLFLAFQKYMLCFSFLACQTFLHLFQVLKFPVGSVNITVDFSSAWTAFNHHTGKTLLLLDQVCTPFSLLLVLLTSDHCENF